MTRKCLTVFIILLFCGYFLISGLLGEDGLLCEWALRRRLQSQNDLLKSLEQRKSELKKQKEAISTKEFLLQEARAFGYGLEGEKATMRASHEAPREEAGTQAPERRRPSEASLAYLPRWAVLLLALVPAAAGALVCGACGRPRRGGGKDDDNRA